jgi:N-acetyl-anhydromuramyl-L-alanine amidase AmpD
MARIKEDNKAKLNHGQFIDRIGAKKQIVLHHTGGSGNPFNTVNWWNSNSERVGTAYVVAGREDRTKSYKDGEIYLTFDDRFYAWHINARQHNQEVIERNSIGIEICNYGFLQRRKNGTFFALISSNPLRVVDIPADQVIDLGYVWRGSRYYHAYTESQIKSVAWLVNHLCIKYSIPKIYNDLFTINREALSGKAGIWGHSNFRTGKSDISPQPLLIEYLQSLQ